MAGRTFPIGELSRQTGCNIETIRYYERVGLMPAPPRCGCYRSYGPEDVERLGFVRRSRGLGFTLEEVRALLGLAAGGRVSCAEVRTLAALSRPMTPRVRASSCPKTSGKGVSGARASRPPLLP